MHPNLRFLVPPNHEGNWTDLLAAFVDNDPFPILALMDIAVPSGGVRVRREVAVPWTDGNGKRRTDRLDLLIESSTDEIPIVVLEAKVLAPVGPDQLERYEQRFPGANTYRLLQLSRFEVSPRSDLWESLTWERLLAAYVGSETGWVAATAQAWLDHVARLVPQVDAGTVWNAVRDFAEGDVDLRARAAWLHARMTIWCEFDPRFSESDTGRSWVVSMEAGTEHPEYTVYVEMEEGLPVRKWNAVEGDERPRSARLQGPTVLIGLTKYSEEVNDFDWPMLVRLFRGRVFDGVGNPVGDRDWRRTAAGASGRPGWIEAVRDAEVVPIWVGQGYDMTKDGWRCFGARFNLAPSLTLGEIDTELERVQELVRSLVADVRG